MTKRSPEIKIVAAVKHSSEKEWTERDVYYFVINSLVYPCFHGRLHLTYPEYHTHGIGRFIPTIEALNDLSLIPKSIIEDVQKTSAEYEYLLTDNQIRKLDHAMPLRFRMN